MKFPRPAVNALTRLLGRRSRDDAVDALVYFDTGVIGDGMKRAEKVLMSN